jgi:hypothetical protein
MASTQDSSLRQNHLRNLLYGQRNNCLDEVDTSLRELLLIDAYFHFGNVKRLASWFDFQLINFVLEK